MGNSTCTIFMHARTKRVSKRAAAVRPQNHADASAAAQLWLLMATAGHIVHKLQCFRMCSPRSGHSPARSWPCATACYHGRALCRAGVGGRVGGCRDVSVYPPLQLCPMRAAPPKSCTLPDHADTPGMHLQGQQRCMAVQVLSNPKATRYV